MLYDQSKYSSALHRDNEDVRNAKAIAEYATQTSMQQLKDLMVVGDVRCDQKLYQQRQRFAKLRQSELKEHLVKQHIVTGKRILINLDLKQLQNKDHYELLKS